MDKKSLVSLITPCHNSGAFIYRLLDSVLEQTYPEIEMITVDNDSKDNTADIIQSYIPKFKEKGYSLTYVKEDDLGPSWAIKNALPLIKGDYLIMPDSDDWFSQKYSIEKMVSRFLELSDEYAVIRCQQQVILDGSMELLDVFLKDNPSEDTDHIFLDCLLGQNGYTFVNISFMVKVKSLKEQTNFDIYAAYNTGQNRQITLPLYYKYKCYTIQEPLVYYLVRDNSISHSDYAKFGNYEKLYESDTLYIDTILSSIKELSVEEKNHYLRLYKQSTTKHMIDFALKSHRYDRIQKYFDDYILYGGDAIKMKLHILNKKLFYTMISVVRPPYKLLCKILRYRR